MRLTQLKLDQKVYITQETKEQLRKLKRKTNKSMAKIVIDLIHQEYIKHYQ